MIRQTNSFLNASQNKLSRELLKWIQSLDLAYSVKNVKRDFANGFLVAEILSRYFDKGISMHSYDNGIATTARKDNWDQLSKFLRKHDGLNKILTKAEINSIIYCENGAAVQFLNRLYEILTQREIQQVPSKPENDIPPYAKHTGTSLMRNKMHSAEILSTNDDSQILEKMEEVNNIHEESLHDERQALRAYNFSSKLSSSSKVFKGNETHKVTEKNLESKVIPVTEVQVKSLNVENLAKLRSKRESGNLQSVSHEASILRNSKISVRSSERSAMDLLNEYVDLNFPNEIMRSYESSTKPSFHKFIDIVREMNDENNNENNSKLSSIIDVLNGLVNEMEVVSGCILFNPKEFHHIIDILFTLIDDLSAETVTFEITKNIFLNLGKFCMKKDESLTPLLFVDYMLPKISNIIRLDSLKRGGLLKIMYSFTLQDIFSHIHMIKKLRDYLNDLPTFIHVLSKLILLENHMDETLLDLYHYYCTIGLDSSSNTLRSSCLSMFSIFVKYDLSLLLSILPRLKDWAFCRSTWWEVHAQLLVVASNVLDIVENKNVKSSMLVENKEDIAKAVDYSLQIIFHEFQTKSSLNIRQIGLSYLSKNLRLYQELVPIYSDILLSIPINMLEQFLSDRGEADELRLIGNSDIQYHCYSIRKLWDSHSIIRHIYFDQLLDKKMDIFLNEAMILASAFEDLTQCKHIPSNTNVEVEELFGDLRSRFINSFLNFDTCQFAISIFYNVAFSSTINLNVLEGDEMCSFFGSKILTLSKDDIRSIQLQKMLTDLSNINTEYSDCVRQFLEDVHHNCPELFNQSPFQSLLNKIN